MLPTESAIGFFGTKAVNTDSLVDIFPEIAPRGDYFLLLSLVIFRSTCSMLSNLVI